MKDERKTKRQLISELVELRQRIAELEMAETGSKWTEEALKESEEKYRKLIETANDAIFIADVETGIILDVNKKGEELLGMPAEKIVGMHQTQLHPKEEAERYSKLFLKHIRSGKLISGDLFVCHKDGHKIPVEISGSVTELMSKKVIQGIFRDITERKRAEKVLKREKERAEEYLNIAGVMLAIVNADENITLINRKGCEVLGYNEEELIGRNWFDTLVPERTRGEVRAVFRKLMVGDIKPVEYYENPLLTKDGEERLILFHNTVIRKSNGQIVASLTSGEDITERKQAEKELKKYRHHLEELVEERAAELKRVNEELRQEITERKRAEKALRESEKRYRLLFENSPIGIGTATRDGRKVVDGNKAIQNIVGYSVEEIKKIDLGDTYENPEDRTKLLEDLDRYGSVVNYPVRLRRKDGTIRDVLFSISQIHVKGENLLQATCLDITERKKAEEQIKASLKEKEILLNEIHHRVKNNLEIISSLLDMSSMRTRNQQAINLLSDAHSKIHTMALIHSQLYQSDRFDRIDMGSYIGKLVNYLSQVYTTKKTLITPIIEHSNIYLTVTQAIPCALVLNEAISNAFKHAFKEGQKGTIEISIKRAADDTIFIRVKDDGIGMPEEIDIYTADSLGLKLVRNLVQDQLMGKIQVERTEGTEIFIEFKILEEEVKHA